VLTILLLYNSISSFWSQYFFFFFKSVTFTISPCWVKGKLLSVCFYVFCAYSLLPNSALLSSGVLVILLMSAFLKPSFPQLHCKLLSHDMSHDHDLLCNVITSYESSVMGHHIMWCHVIIMSSHFMWTLVFLVTYLDYWLYAMWLASVSCDLCDNSLDFLCTCSLQR